MPAKLDRCVEKVKKTMEPGEGNPFAICNASLGKGKKRKKGKKK